MDRLSGVAELLDGPGLVGEQLDRRLGHAGEGEVAVQVVEVGRNLEFGDRHRQAGDRRDAVRDPCQRGRRAVERDLIKHETHDARPYRAGP